GRGELGIDVQRQSRRRGATAELELRAQIARSRQAGFAWQMGLHERELEPLELQEPPVFRAFECLLEGNVRREACLQSQRGVQLVLAPWRLELVLYFQLQLTHALGRVQLTREGDIQRGPFAKRHATPLKEDHGLGPSPTATHPSLQRSLTSQLFLLRQELIERRQIDTACLDLEGGLTLRCAAAHLELLPGHAHAYAFCSAAARRAHRRRSHLQPAGLATAVAGRLAPAP